MGIEGVGVLVSKLTVYAHTKFGQFIIIFIILEMLFLFLPTGYVTI